MRIWTTVRRGQAGGSKAGAADMGAAHEDGCAAFMYEAAGRVGGQDRLTRTGRAAARMSGGENGRVVRRG